MQIFDNFYDDPDQVRINVLGRNDWGSYGNYPGIRTGKESYQQSLFLRNFFEDIMGMRINDWNTGANTCFQNTYCWDDTWIHSDQTDWAGIIYLTPDAPVESGTGFFRHKKTGFDSAQQGRINEKEGYNLDNWDKTAEVGNIYNRLVIYNAKLYHRSMLPGFGNSIESGRLTQTFFFNENMVW